MAFEVSCVPSLFRPPLLTNIHGVQGGFHEMANEPDGDKEKYVGAVIEWVLKHSQSVAAQESAKL